MNLLPIVCHECHTINMVNMKERKSEVPCKQCKTDLDDPFPVEVTDESALTYINDNGTPLLLDFYSTTCGPCMAMYEDYENAALGFGLKVKFLKINTDKHTTVAAKYGVGALPTIIAFSAGQEVSRISNQLSQAQLTLWAEELSSKNL